MKRLLLPLAIAMCSPALAQDPSADSTGLPGDNFSLQGALELFKRNIEMEKFEEELNTDSTHVNNLDLNGDGQTDYVRVETQRDGDAVNITLKVAVSATESQDVAVIGIEKTGEESAVLQIQGDEDLYPPNTIVEPFAEEERAVPTKGPRAPALTGVQVAVNVWFWRPIPWCFSPRFYAYSSPWYWGSYPLWWRPWRPHLWRPWWGWGRHYHAWYRPWGTCRVVHARALYTPRRARSTAVHERFQTAHERHMATRPGKPAAKPARPVAPKAVRPAHGTRPKGSPKGQRPAAPRKTRPRGGGRK